MCLACEGDELWMLYLEQLAAKQRATGGVANASGESSPRGGLIAAATRTSPDPHFTCEEPAGE
jgi:hypothetical protein